MDRQAQIEQQLERMRTLYVAKTGLGRLPDFEKDTSTAPNGVESCFNDNGILYRTLAVIQAIRAGAVLSPQDKELLASAVISLRCDPSKAGLYNRQPHGDVKPSVGEQHDNFIGVLLADWYTGGNKEAQGMISHFWRNWGCFNNIDPKKFDWKYFRQFGEVAVYYMAAKRRAPFLFTLWFLGGVIINARKIYPHGEASRLTFMRLFLIDNVGVKGFFQRFLYKKVRNFWFKKLAEKFGGNGITPIMLEYGDGHPVNEFEKLVQYA
jgi:hypothetical protein